MKKNKINSNESLYDEDLEYALYCDAFEGQYKKAKEDGVFEILRLIELDKTHSTADLVQAVDYFNSKNGIVEKSAPTDFLTEREKRIINQDGKFRPHLYSMFLSQNLSESLQNKKAFIKHSFKYAFDS